MSSHRDLPRQIAARAYKLTKCAPFVNQYAYQAVSQCQQCTTAIPVVSMIGPIIDTTHTTTRRRHGTMLFRQLKQLSIE